MQGSRRTIWLALAGIAAIALAVVMSLSGRSANEPLTYSALKTTIAAGQVSKAVISPDTRQVELTLKDGSTQTAWLPRDADAALAAQLDAKDVEVTIAPITRPNPLLSLFGGLLPFILIGLLLWWYMRRTSRIGAGGANLTKSATIPTVTFADVAGMPETVEQMRDIATLITDLDRYAAAGIEVPAGILLTGPPGNGKTLLARAMAGELGVPFFAANGADFVETFVGAGARRVRDLFKAARKASDEHGFAIVFVDEVDAVGRKRGNSEATGDAQESERTLNALLSEMHGFSGKHKVFVLAATNRADILDPALTRPGRLDRTVTVPNPDRAGREAILRMYAAKRDAAGTLPFDVDVDFHEMSRRCPGASGAELEAWVAEAARRAVKHDHATVTREDMEDALATVVLGPERRSAEMARHEVELTAWHEAGHTVCAYLQPDCENPVQVTIVGRGQAGGVTWLTQRDAHYATVAQLKADLVTKMGGRAAEEMLLGGTFTTGASADLASATDLARSMVCTYGMSSIGLQAITGQTLTLGSTADKVHDEVEALLAEALEQARGLLRANRALFDAVVADLLENETVHLADIERLNAQVTGGAR